MKVINGVIKQLKKKVSSLEDDNSIVQKTNEELRRRYSKQKTLMETSVGILV